MPGGLFVEVFAGTPPCGLRPDGDYVCWSDLERRLPRFMAGEPLVQAASGKDTSYAYSCGVRPDSTLLCWAHDYSGDPDVVGGRLHNQKLGWSGTAVRRR